LRLADVTEPLLGYNIGGRFFSPAGPRSMHTAPLFADLLAELLQESPAGSVFAKPVMGLKGRQCYRIDEVPADPQRLASLHRRLLSDSYVFEQTIQQHPVLGALYPHSVNTLRLITYLDHEGQVRFLSAFLRCGANR
jgi:hypothetical protein